MAVFYTSDLHIGHQFVAGLRGFDTFEEHDAYLAEQWDAMVNPNGNSNDSVIVCGDISAGGSRAQHRALAWFMQRPGNKHLITGNHDGPHPMNRDSAQWQKKYMGVFESVQQFQRKKIAGRYVMLSHFPYQGAGDRGPEERYPQYRLPDMGLPLVHGHTHSDEVLSATDQGTTMIHVGVDAWGLKPIPLQDLEELVLNAA